MTAATEVTPNPGRDLNRAAKARRLADALESVRSDIEGDAGVGFVAAAAALPVVGRQRVAELANVAEPSEATWSAVVAILEDRAARPRRGTKPCGHPSDWACSHDGEGEF